LLKNGIPRCCSFEDRLRLATAWTHPQRARDASLRLAARQADAIGPEAYRVWEEAEARIPAALLLE
jgi:hypothetical protein